VGFVHGDRMHMTPRADVIHEFDGNGLRIEAADGVMLVVQGAMRHPLAEIEDPTTHAAA
jgi:hypothetical protein